MLFLHLFSTYTHQRRGQNINTNYTYSTMPLDRTLFIKVYLNRLVNSLVPSDFGTEYSNSLVNDLVLQLLKTSPDPNLNIYQTLDEIKVVLLTQNRSSDWLRLREIVDLIAKEKSMDRVCAYLLFLCEFAQDTKSKRSGFAASESLNRASGPFSQSAGTFNQSATAFDQSPGPFNKTMSSPSHLFLPTQTSPDVTRHNQPMSRLIDPYSHSLLEAQIIASLEHSLLGHDTKFLAYLKAEEAIDIPPTIDNSDARILCNILEPGLIFRLLSKFSDESKGATASPIKVSFYRCVESVLNDYVAFITQLFQSKPTSLIAIYNSLADQTQILRLVRFFLNQCSSLDGYDFLVKVHKVSKFGDPRVQKLASDIFNTIVAPYYEYIEQWIIRGELIDEHSDFFVSFNAEENHINDIVKYNARKLPNFLKAEPAMFVKVLQIGKTLIFLSKFCKELDWVNNYSVRYSQHIFQANRGLGSMSPDKIHNLINAQYHEVLNYFVVVIQGKYLLFLHLLNLKSIMLMSNGDFVEVINSKGAEIFGEPAMYLTSGRLSDLLTLSIEASTIRTYPSNYLNRIDARILDLSHGSIGWDVFTLEYKLLELPLEILMNYNNASTQYLRLFHFLWSLRHYQYLLNDNFLEFQSLQKNDMKTLAFRSSERRGTRTQQEKTNLWFVKAVRTINLVRSRLQAVIRVLLKYLSFDLIEEMFHEKVVKSLFRAKSLLGANFTTSNRATPLPILNSSLAEKLQNKSFLPESLAVHNMNECTIDDITNIHGNYLESISRCKLLNEEVKGRVSGESFIDQIFEILELVFAFVKSSGEFCASMINYMNIVNINGAHLDAQEQFDGDLAQLHQRLQALVKIIYSDIYTGKFVPSMDVFVKDLRSDLQLKELSKLF